LVIFSRNWFQHSKTFVARNLNLYNGEHFSIILILNGNSYFPDSVPLAEKHECGLREDKYVLCDLAYIYIHTHTHTHTIVMAVIIMWKYAGGVHSVIQMVVPNIIIPYVI